MGVDDLGKGGSGNTYSLYEVLRKVQLPQASGSSQLKPTHEVALPLWTWNQKTEAPSSTWASTLRAFSSKYSNKGLE